ncbi:hypothetical protein ACQ3G7_10615 [Kosakonia oryzendophytica]|uniref:hypothetical protein n=1 Tax=Kosakonia oryzendophytica TaxID=1005665 RepID=UPI003D3454A9
MGNLSVSASKRAALAKMQREPSRASLIYKTAFLLLQKTGSKMRCRQQNPAKRQDLHDEED